ncbi:DNA topoisomerase 3 [Alicyclobacillus tolerans]|uniref:type IA DNA topoisomerase n=1 Tax=Alicyclobacillus tolerans TaxID=90970 RepID=UPI001F01A29D|nr:type IA DNA topoisomerase [Alicyclobacillus tolerans]MCF8567941.1 DNA topoisomerase 3 [Alicyclobacillus tolerans]
MKLLIAEKPSVARDIASVLGGVKRQNGYLETSNYTVTWAVGHLVTLADAHDYDEKYKKWYLEDLPIVPNPFKLKVLDSSRDQYKVVSRLLKQAEEVVVATDAGREGQLIYELIAAAAGYKGPTKRLWLSSMTEEAIRESLARIRDNKEYQNLFHAGFARSQADWLVGINATRAMTVHAGTLLPVGRVQTPTLAMIVNRDMEIENFKPVPYFEVEATFVHMNGTYKGKWHSTQKTSRLDLKSQAELIVEKTNGKPGEITRVEQKTSKEQPPQLFDLTSLQRKANQVAGFTADKTLKLVQSLYETHKVLTYPRTDSRYISDDIVPTMAKRLSSAVATFSEYGNFLPESIIPTKRVVDAQKVTDHHAIIPTEKVLSSEITHDERVIYELVTKQTIAAFLDSAEWASTVIETTVEGELFRTSGRVLLKDGWRAVLGKKDDEEEKGDKDEDSPSNLPIVTEQDTCITELADVLSKQTKPPFFFTEASLLSAMEHAGKQVDDDTLAEAMKERGLGTPATRSSIIEKLKKDGYIRVDKKKLLSTEKGRTLIQAIRVPVLKSPELTGEWEFKLKQIENGKETLNTFIQNTVVFTKEVIQEFSTTSIHVESTSSRAVLGKCPLCGGDVTETPKFYGCSNWKSQQCTFKVWKDISGHKMSPAQVKALLTKRQTKPLQFKSKKDGKLFDAVLVLRDTGKVEFEFSVKSTK